MRRLLTAAATLLFAAACGNNPADSTDYQNSSGAVALSRDDALVYVADSDNGTLSVVDAARREKIAELQVGRNPEHVVVGPDDTIYVSNRGSRSVSVIRRDQWNAPVATVDVGVEPYAMAFADEGRTLLVVNSASLSSVETGTLMGIDTQTFQPTFEVEVGDEPRGVAVTDGRALVSLHRRGEVVAVNLTSRTVEGKRLNDIETVANRSAPEQPTFSPGDVTFKPRGMTALAVTPDGKRAFSSVVWSSNAVLDAPAKADESGAVSSGPAYGSSGACGGAGVAAGGALTFDAKEMTSIIQPLTSCSFDSTSDAPAPVMKDPVNGHLQGPTAVVVDPTGQWLFVANKESNNVAVMPTVGRPERFDGSTVTQTVPVPAGPVGLALSRDGRIAWVYSLFEHKLVSIEATNTLSGAPVLQASEAIQIAADVFDVDVVKGRELFFSAVDTRMNSIGISCGTCHVDAREDGHVWNFKNGPRQTPSLAGRMLGKTAPYHWNGEHASFNDFVSHTVTARMGGAGLGQQLEGQLLAFIESVKPPDNPFKFDAPNEAQVRGAQVFQKAACNSCHGGEALTNNQTVDVGTFVVGDTDPGLNTPSLLAVARTGPFLHDGSAPTLESRIRAGQSANLHGNTSALTDGEVSDLVAYLKSL